MEFGKTNKQRKRSLSSRVFSVGETAPNYGAPGIVLYQAPDGDVTLDVRLERETIWLSLNQMAVLFGRDKSVISRHLANVFKTEELERDSVVAFFTTTTVDGKYGSKVIHWLYRKQLLFDESINSVELLVRRFSRMEDK